jgi:hypothetical protein
LFILKAIGTFISVSGLTFTFFQFWAKRREEKDSAFRASITNEMKNERALSRQEILDERAAREKETRRLESRMEKLEDIMTRIGGIEGEMRGMRGTLQKIQDWFINGGRVG